MSTRLRVLVTGAAGYTGSNLMTALENLSEFEVRGTDVRSGQSTVRRDIRVCDIRDRMGISDIVSSFSPHAVVHLASIVTPGPKSRRDLEFEVDVTGTQNVLDACTRAEVQRLIVASSGAAYGYHADNPVPLKESDPLRGNRDFAYSYHKRLIEERLALHRETQALPEIVIFRIGTILGKNTDNQITALFDKKTLAGIRGSDSPFVFIWDQDVAGAILHALRRNDRGGFVAPAGIYNLAGDGWMNIDEIAKLLKKPVRKWSPAFLRCLFAVMKPLGISRYGPEQVRFLQYRPILDNTALKETFGYTPMRTSREVFDLFCQARTKDVSGEKR